MERVQRRCPACASTNLSWDFGLDKFYIGCDECSETVEIARMEDIAGVLNMAQWRLSMQVGQS